MKNIKRFGYVLTIIGVVLGVLGLPGTANAATGDGDFHFTVVSASYDYDAADLTITNETRATVNGATQLTWWFPNHNIKVSKKSVRKAPHIKVRYVGCAKQSKWIAKKTHGASIVVAKPGSKMCNTGKNGNIVGGFVWTVPSGRPAVLKWNKHLRLYQHVYNIVGGKLVKTCGNHIGGHVDVMYNNVVQVQYEQDVQMNGIAHAKAGVHTSVEFGVTCPNGAYFNVSASGFAYGYAQADVSFTARTRASVLEAHRPKLTLDTHGGGQVSAVANAQTSIDVSGSCGSTPPPQPTMSLSLDRPNDVDQSIYTPGQPIDWSFTKTMGHAAAPAGEGDVTYTVSADIGTVKFVTANSPCETNGLRDNVVSTITEPSGTYDLTLCYIASTEDPASYGGVDHITLKSVFSGQTYSATQPITVNPTPQPPL